MEADFFHYKILSSTQDFAKSHLAMFHPDHLSIIYADKQTSGRAQFERTWFSNLEGNIYATFVFFLPPDTNYLASLGQIMALAVIDAASNFPLYIKWPNDLFLHGKKLGGILAETTPFGPMIACLIGLGVNVNMPAHILASQGLVATSLQEASSATWQVQDLILTIQKLLASHLLMLKTCGAAFFQEKLNQKLLYKNEMIDFLTGNTLYTGKLLGIDTKGGLLLEIEGKAIPFYSGRIQMK